MTLQPETRLVEVEGAAFPVTVCGRGPAVLLLHGFPDSRHLWRKQIPALSGAGLQVIAPDLPGFGDAPRPQALSAYQVPAVARTLLALLDALEVESVRLVGHDWGAAVAWELAAYYPGRVERLVSLGVGCPGTSGLRSIEQQERFWFFYFFQFEGVAEAWLAHDDWKLLRQWTRGNGDLERYLQDLSRPGALTAALNWYRANVRPEPPDRSQPDFPLIGCPVMGVWSDGDDYMTEDHLFYSYEKIAGEWRYEKIRGASHWMMLDKPEALNRLLLDFLGTA